MSKEDNHIDDFFTENLGGHEIVPPPDVWANIEKKLDRKRRVAVITLWKGLAAGLALLIGVGVFYLYNRQSQVAPVAIVKPAATPEKYVANNKTAGGAIKSANTMLIEPQKTEINRNYGNGTIDEEIKIDTASRFVSDNKAAENTPETYFVSAEPVATPQAEEVSGRDNLAMIGSRKMLLSGGNFSSPLITKKEQPPVVSSDYLLAYTNSVIEDEAPKYSKKWSVEAQIAPQYSYRNISDLAEGLPSKEQFNSQEKGLMAYTGGVKVSYETKGRFSIQTGIMYSVIGQTLNEVYAVRGPAYYVNSVQYDMAPKVGNYWANNSLGPITKQPSGEFAVATSQVTEALGFNSLLAASKTNVSQDVKLTQKLNYIEIPVFVRYKLFEGKFGVHVLGGFSTNLLVDNNVWVESGSAKNNIGKTENLRALNYSSSIGMGVNYKLWEHATLSLEPIYKYYLNSITRYSEIKYHPYSFGVYTGFCYKF